jgi:hypothetical protein
MYTCVMTNVDSSLTDLYTGYWSPSHDNLYCFKVSVLVPLEWGHQMLSRFVFSTYSYISCMCPPLVMWSNSNHIAAFALDLKSPNEGEYTIFGLLSLVDFTQNDVLHPLLFISIFLPLPCCFYCYGSVVQFEVGYRDTSSLALFCRILPWLFVVSYVSKQTLG